MRLATSLVTCVFALGFVSLSLADEPAAAPAADPAVAERLKGTEQVLDAADAMHAAAEKVVSEIQGRLKTLTQNVVKAKAEAAKIQGEVTAAEKLVTDAQAVVKKATDDAAPVKKAYADAQAAEKAATDAKAAADKVVVDSAALAKAVADTAATAKVAVDASAGAKNVADLKALADQVAAQTDAAAKEAVTKAQAAATALTAATAATKAAEEKAAAADKVIADETAKLKPLEEAVAAAKQKLVAPTEAVAQADAAVAAGQTELNNAQATLTASDAAVDAALKAHEDSLQAAGKLVSFSKHIAPMFVKRCLACHNAQTAKGRYNMETFFGVMKGGEQGDTIIGKKPDESNLLALLEDGTMPQDADPVSPEEIALVKQWIANGARLDSGLKRESPLVTIMPKMPQPMPPDAYRVALPVTALAWSPDGNMLASSGYHEVLLWNPADGASLRRITNVAERVYDVEFSADGKMLVVGAGTPGQMGEVKIFNPADGSLIKDVVTTNDCIFGVALSPDGKQLAVCSADRSIRLFNMETFAQERIIEDHADWVMDIAWSPDGTKLASASRDKTSKLFDAKTGESLITFPGHGDVVYGVAFSPDGTQVLSAGRDNKIRAWNPADAKQIREMAGFGAEVYRVSVSADGRIFTCSADKTAREHKLADGAAVRTFAGHTDWVYSVAYHAATKRVATGSWDGEIRIWNADDAKGTLTFVGSPIPAPTGQPTAAK